MTLGILKNYEGESDDWKVTRLITFYERIADKMDKIPQNTEAGKASQVVIKKILDEIDSILG